MKNRTPLAQNLKIMFQNWKNMKNSKNHQNDTFYTQNSNMYCNVPFSIKNMYEKFQKHENSDTGVLYIKIDENP